jgi:hypothetical protein
MARISLCSINHNFHIMTFPLLIYAVFLTIFLFIGQQGFAQSLVASGFGGALYHAVFFPHNQPVSINTGGLPPEAAERIGRFNQRNKAFHSRLAAPGDLAPGPRLWQLQKRRQLERGIVALVEVQGVERLAADYAEEAVIYYEWEAISEKPLQEAGFAEDYLQKKPETPIRPYLYLFLAQRYRCAAEILAREKAKNQEKNAREKYQHYLKLSRTQPDPLIGLIAADLESQPYLYLRAESPRRSHQLPSSPATPAHPELSIESALKLAENYLKEKQIDTSGRYINSVHLEYDDGSRQYPNGVRRRGYYWYIHWAWATPRLGGELSVRVFMNKEIILERHGP